MLFVFRGKPSNMSQTENSARPKGEFFMMTAITILLKNERGDAHEEIEKQNISGLPSMRSHRVGHN